MIFTKLLIISRIIVPFISRTVIVIAMTITINKPETATKATTH